MRWLRHTFDPALRTSKPPYEQLRAELGALSEAGVLVENEASRALARLDEDERNLWAIVRRKTERAIAEARSSGGAEDRLEGLLTPERPLCEVDGITVVVRRIELWTSRLVLRLEALQNQLTDALDASFDTEWKAWERHWVEDRAAAEVAERPPPEQASVSRLNELSLSVADDLGTRYHAVGKATGGSEHPWRSEWCIEPWVPRSASLLRIALEDGERDRERLVFALPSRT
jgi:predicted DCC family thiol-disulfide oxidoreductase YuxK